MYNTKSYRRAIRLTEGLEAARCTEEQIEGSESTFLYGVCIQVKIGFGWLTVWKEQCAPEDGDARLKIKARAYAVLDAMEVVV